MKRLTSLICAVLITGAILPVHAADFTWTTGAGGNNDARWDLSANWGGAGTPNAAGDTANILANWPTTAFGTRTIQLRQIPTTVGVLNVNTSEGDAIIVLQTTQTLVFDNNGSTAEVNGASTNQLRFNAQLVATDTIAIDVAGMSAIRVDRGITGVGGVTITGDSVSTTSAAGSNDGNDVYFQSGTYDYTGETRIDSGVLQMSQHVTSLGSTSIIVNGEWDLDLTPFAAPTGYFLLPTQTLSGTGTVQMDEGVKAESRSIRSDGATVAPGDGGVGTLTVAGAGLSLTGGTFQFEVGEAGPATRSCRNASTSPARRAQSSSPTCQLTRVSPLGRLSCSTTPGRCLAMLQTSG